MKKSVFFLIFLIFLMGSVSIFSNDARAISANLLLAVGPEVEKGKKVFEEKRCSVCHAIGGRGGKIGPDLSDIGNERDADWLMKFLQDPKGTIPGAKMMPVKANNEELLALVDYLLFLKK